MNLSWNNFTKDTTTSAPTLSQEVARRLLLFYIIQTTAYIVLSSVALFGNTLVILVFVFDRRLLKKSYNILILSLAVSDVLSAVIVIMTHVANHYFLPSNPVYGAIFCKLIATFFFPWQLLFFSVYICLLLSVERWIAIVKPHKYSSIFRRKNVAGCILASWVWSCLLMSSAILDMEYNPNSVFRCRVNIIGKGSSARLFVGVFQVMMMVFFPCLVMIGLYIHMIVSVNSSVVASAESKAKLRGKMTWMVAIVCFILIICYTPSRIFLFLAFTGNVNIYSTVNGVLSLLTFFSNCINPLVYGFSNGNFRQRYKNVFSSLC